jgi:hypothetical protein
VGLAVVGGDDVRRGEHLHVGDALEGVDEDREVVRGRDEREGPRRRKAGGTPQEAATGPQEPQEAAAGAAPRYTVNLHVISLHGGERVREVYQGGDETVMYSHVSAIEWTLAMTGGTAEIEIVEDGRERWIDYQDGKRDGLPQEAE